MNRRSDRRAKDPVVGQQTRLALVTGNLLDALIAQVVALAQVAPAIWRRLRRRR